MHETSSKYDFQISSLGDALEGTELEDGKFPQGGQ